MSAPAWMHELTRQAAVALFEAYQAPVVPRAESIERSFDVGVVIGFVSPQQMVGSLTLGMDLKAVQRSMPAYLNTWRDWAGELGNQLLGRVVNELVRYGLRVHMSTPVVLNGQQLAVDGSVWGDVRLDIGGAPVGVVLHCEFEPGFVLVEPQLQAVVAKEADAVELF